MTHWRRLVVTPVLGVGGQTRLGRVRGHAQLRWEPSFDLDTMDAHSVSLGVAV